MGQRLGTVVFLGVHLDRTGIWLIAVGMPPVQYFWTVGNILAVDEPGSHGNVALFDAAAAGFVHIVVQPRTEGLGCSINIALLHGRCVYRCDAADIGRVPHGELLCDRAAFAVADNVTLAFVNTAQLTAHAGLESLPDVFMFAACGFVGFFGVPTTTVCGFEYEQHQLFAVFLAVSDVDPVAFGQELLGRHTIRRKKIDTGGGGLGVFWNVGEHATLFGADGKYVFIQADIGRRVRMTRVGV